MTIRQSFMPPPTPLPSPSSGVEFQTQTSISFLTCFHRNIWCCCTAHSSGEAVFGSGPHDITLGCGPVSKKVSKIKAALFGLLVKWMYIVICVYMCVCVCECVCLCFSDNDSFAFDTASVPNSTPWSVILHFCTVGTVKLLLHHGSARAHGCLCKQEEKQITDPKQDVFPAGRISGVTLWLVYLDSMHFRVALIFTVNHLFGFKCVQKKKKKGKYIHHYCWLKSSGLVFG